MAALAVAMVGAGAVAAFVTDNGAGVAALLAAGTLLLMIVALGERIETLRWGDVELTLRRQADAAAAAGDEELEQQLRAAADSLTKRAAPVASSYEAVRRSMRSGAERTRAMEAEVARAREDARSGEFESAELAQLFRDGSDGERVYALGVMQHRPDLAPAEIVLEAVRSPKSPFEHYHALVLADRAIPHLSEAEGAALAAAVEHELTASGFHQDTDRATVAARILARLRPRSSD